GPPGSPGPRRARRRRARTRRARRRRERRFWVSWKLLCSCDCPADAASAKRPLQAPYTIPPERATPPSIRAIERDAGRAPPRVQAMALKGSGFRFFKIETLFHGSRDAG